MPPIKKAKSNDLPPDPSPEFESNLREQMQRRMAAIDIELVSINKKRTALMEEHKRIKSALKTLGNP